MPLSFETRHVSFSKHAHGPSPHTNTAFIRLTITIHGFILPSARKTLVAWKEPLTYLPVMKVIQDCFGTSVRLTDERLEHILDHPELVGMANELERVLQTPMEVRRSRSDDDVKLFYEFYAQTQVGGKLLCVV